MRLKPDDPKSDILVLDELMAPWAAVFSTDPIQQKMLVARTIIAACESSDLFAASDIQAALWSIMEALVENEAASPR